MDAGFVSLDLLREHAARGFVRPSLVLQVEEHIDDPNSLSLAARRLDRDFVAPWRKLPGATRRRVGRRLDVLAAGLRAHLHPGLKRQQRHRARHGSLRSNYDRPFRAALADL